MKKGWKEDRKKGRNNDGKNVKNIDNIEKGRIEKINFIDNPRIKSRLY